MIEVLRGLTNEQLRKADYIVCDALLVERGAMKYRAFMMKYSGLYADVMMVLEFCWGKYEREGTKEGS
jgi:hypothetical protein